jgi:hypothetical protein
MTPSLAFCNTTSFFCPSSLRAAAAASCIAVQHPMKASYQCHL